MFAAKKYALYLLIFISLNALSAPPTVTPAVPTINAKSYLLFDVNSQEILAEHNADVALDPASLTKIMTAYVVAHELKSGQISLQDEVLISKKAWKTGGSKMFIEVNKRVLVDKLLKGMIIQSGNDASVALAEHVAGSEEAFSQLMNKHAKHLGMKNSHFTNATGLPTENHYSSAHDMALLSAALIKEYPTVYALFSEKEYTYNDIRQHNRNKLLWRDSAVDGVKTGYTKAAGYCLVAAAKRDHMRLISVVMGTESVNARNLEGQKLLNFGFRFYDTRRLYTPNDTISNVRLYKGNSDSIAIGTGKDLYITVPRGQFDNIDAKLDVQPNLIAPLSKHQTVGKLTLTLHDKVLEEVPAVTLFAAPEGSIWKRLMDSALLWWEE